MITQDAMELAELARLHQQLLGGGASGISEVADRPGMPVTQGRYSNNSNPLLEAPAGHLDFFPKGTATFSAGPPPTAAQIVLTLNVPVGYDGVIKAIGNVPITGGFINGSGEIIWRIRANGRAIRNFENINSVMGTEDWPVDLAVGIPIFSGTVITYEVEWISNAAWAELLTLCTFKGYFYPVQGGGAA